MEYVHRVVDALYNMLPFRMPPDGAVLLGRAYAEDEEEAFVQDFASRLLFTYRRDFAPLASGGASGGASDAAGTTSDAGWGCAIRVAQMQLAECVVHARVVAAGAISVSAARAGVLELFQDAPHAPFSVHKFVEVGTKRLGKTSVTQWFGPTSAAQAAAALATQARAGEGEQRELPKFLCFEDGVIYEDEVREALSPGAHAAGRASCVFFVCKKLGVDFFNVERYKHSIYKIFTIPAFRGLASGESTTSAYFFVAVSDDSLYFLDPHIAVQSAATGSAATGASGSGSGAGKTFQDKILRIPWSRLNASMTLAFFVKNEHEFEQLLAKLKAVDSELFESMPSRVRFRDRTTAVVANDGEEEELLLIN